MATKRTAKPKREEQDIDPGLFKAVLGAVLKVTPPKGRKRTQRKRSGKK